MSHKYLVIIPAYNERENIERLVRGLLVHPSVDVLVVDDGNDGTDEIVARLAAHEPRVRLLKRQGKGGRGTAVMDGLRLGIADAYEYFIEMDADYSHPPEALPQLLELASERTIVIGSRYVWKSRIVNWPLSRHVFSALANVYARVVLGIPIHDYTNGYRVYSRAAVTCLLARRIFAKGYIVLSEIGYILHRHGFRFREHPIVFVNRSRGGSNFSLKEIREAFIATWQIRARHREGILAPGIVRQSIVIFLLSFALHAGIFLTAFSPAYLAQNGTDQGQYQLLADNLLAGNGLSLHTQPPFVPDVIRTPLYPAFLALIKRLTGSFFPSLYVTMVLGATLPVAGYLLARLLTADRRALWLVTFLLAVDTNLVYYSYIYGSEGISVPLLAWSVVLCAYAMRAGSWRAAAAGLVTGAATLARPISQFLPFVLAGIVWFDTVVVTRTARRQAVQVIAACLAAFALVVSPWLLRNYILFGVADYSNVGWFNMYTRTAATAEAIHEHRDYPTMRLEYLERLREKGYVQTKPVTELDVFGFAFKPIFQKESLEVIARYPKEFVLSQVSAFFTIVSQDSTVVILNSLGYMHAPYPNFSPLILLAREGAVALLSAVWDIATNGWAIALLGRAFYGIIFLLSAWAPIIAWRKDRYLFPLVLFLWLHQMMVIALSLNIAAQADSRYRAQFIFSELPLAAYVVMQIIRQRKGSYDTPTHSL